MSLTLKPQGEFVTPATYYALSLQRQSIETKGSQWRPTSQVRLCTSATEFGQPRKANTKFSPHLLVAIYLVFYQTDAKKGLNVVFPNQWYSYYWCYFKKYHGTPRSPLLW